jgi:hypothetical protein
MDKPPIEDIEATIAAAGPLAALDRLAEICRGQKKYPQLFEARLMKKRFQLGLPLQGTETFRDIPPSLQAEVEDYYVEVCREVGSLFLESGDIVNAWPYFRAIDEPQQVAAAIDRFVPPDPNASETYVGGGSVTDAVIDIALSQGANPRRGYELALSQYGVCRAITLLEHQFPYTGEVKESCAALLIRRLHGDLLGSLRADIQRREGKAPEGSDIRQLLENRPWLFEGYGYHVDVSHLQSAIRVSATLEAKDVLALALEMAEYGRKLPRDFQSHDRPPFDDFYNDYRIFFQALLGIGVDGAVRYFTQKAERATPDDDGKHLPGEILVHLLWRVGRTGEAIAAFLKYLRNYRGQLTAAPPLIELCDRAGDFSKLLELARERDDLLQYTAALVKRSGGQTPD